MEALIQEQDATQAARRAATAAIPQAQEDAVSTLHRLDAVMANLLRENAHLRAVWSTARHIQRARSRKHSDPGNAATAASGRA
jgi:hypothetical protein